MATVTIGTSLAHVAQDVNPHAAPAQAEISTLPAGLPAKLHSELAWTGQDFGNESDYVFVLTEADCAEVAAALEHFKGRWADHT